MIGCYIPKIWNINHTTQTITSHSQHKLSKVVYPSSDNLIGRKDSIATKKLLCCLFSGVPKILVRELEGWEKGSSGKFWVWAGPIEILTQIEDEDLAQGINF